MSAEIVVRFEMHVRCENCARDSVLMLDVPNVEGAPTTIDDVLGSGLIDRQPYSCAGCECPAASLIAINPFKHRKAEEMLKRPMAADGRVTLFVVMGFKRDKAGRLEADQPIQAQTAESAKRKAQRYADAGGGAIATSQTGDPVLGDWDEPMLIVHCGQVPRYALDQIRDAA